MHARFRAPNQSSVSRWVANRDYGYFGGPLGIYFNAPNQLGLWFVCNFLYDRRQKPIGILPIGSKTFSHNNRTRR